MGPFAMSHGLDIPDAVIAAGQHGLSLATAQG
jgi:hypothetical protein